MSLPYLEFTADSHQAHNPAGANWVIKLNTEHFIKPWPAATDIVNGVVMNLPLLRADAGFNMLKPVPGTLQYKHPTAGRHGHQFHRHEIAYEVANDSEAISFEMEKDINSTAVFIVGKPDGRMIILGKSISGLQFTHDGDSGLEGGENKTSVRAFSNIQLKRPLFLNPALEADLKLIHDGYSLVLKFGLPIQAVDPISPGATPLTNLFNIVDVNQVNVGRKFAIGDQIELLRIYPIVAGKPFVTRPKSDGYVTATIANVANTIGLPAGWVNQIDYDNPVARNIPTGDPGVVLVSAGLWRFDTPLAIQKI